MARPRARRRSREVTIGAVVLALVTVAAFLVPLLSPDPYAIDIPERLQPPSTKHWFGTDDYGRDLFSRVAYGARVSLLVGLAVSVLASVLGTAIGLAAAYWRHLDTVLMRALDGFMAFPALLLAIAVMAAMGPSTANVVVALTVVFTPLVARVVRASTLVVREQTFVEALESQGAGSWRILVLNILPNVFSPILVQFTFIFADSMITEAALSFLGAGVPPPAPTWGSILFDGKMMIFSAWWMVLFPGLAIAATVLAVNMLGDGLRDSLDPHLKENFQ